MNKQDGQQSLAEVEPSLAEVDLGNSYQPDLELADRYQQFSAEILRLALLGIAGVGFLISNVVLSKENSSFRDKLPAIGSLLGSSVLFLGVSVATALAHRFFATDCISDLVQFLRKVKRSGHSAADEQRKWFHFKLKVCAWLLVAAAASLALGVILVAVSFAIVLFR